MSDRLSEGSDKPPFHLRKRDDYKPSDIEWIASRFAIAEPVTIAPFPGKGNINLHTYHVVADGAEYLLQKVNAYVFTMPHRVMGAMIRSIKAQRSALDNGHPAQDWTPIELIPTRAGAEYLDLDEGRERSVWRLMVRIDTSESYKSLSEISDREGQLKLAYETARGLAIYSDLTSSIDPEQVAGSLPGYRDTAVYYRLFHSVMAGNRTTEEAEVYLPQDESVRESTKLHFVVHADPAKYKARKNDPELREDIRLLIDAQPSSNAVWNAINEKRIRSTLIHGDPKIENFLFCQRTGRVKSLVDLDTIMAFSWLSDWGDMVRSMVNVAGEKERDLSKVGIDTEIFDAVAEGFLAEARDISDQEFALMVPAIQIAILELGLRFLTDYVRGDSYFQLQEHDAADLNKVRARVQMKLYRDFVEFGPEAERRLAAIRARA